MLTALHIESFMRLAYADIDLTGAAVHAFWGGNEDGKSSLCEAVRFLYRGMNERVLKKADFDLLITTGKRGGFVEAVANDSPMRRNIRDGKLTSREAIDFDEDHIDLQLGAIQFGKTSPDTLRPLLLDVFKAKADEKFVRERLEHRKLSPEIIALAMPLIKSVGFASAEKKASAEVTAARGQWKGITGEVYGHVKAETWEPAFIATTPCPKDDEIRKWTNEVKRLTDMKSEYATHLAAANQTLKLRGLVSDGTTVDDAEAALSLSQQELIDCEEKIRDTEATFTKSIEDAETQLRAAETALIQAKNAAALLKCPCCGEALQAALINNVPVLERATETRLGDADVRAAASLVERCKLSVAARRKAFNDSMLALNAARGRAQDATQENRTTLESARKLAVLPKVTQDDIDSLTTELQLIEEPLKTAQAKLEELQVTRKQLIEAAQKVQRARAAHKTAQEWAVVEELCGPTSAGLPAELIGRVTKPLNAAIVEIATMWGIQAAVVSDDMRVMRQDGMPYFLLSESARWRLDVQIQLALARLTKLKLAVIDRFDLLEPADRGAYFYMLSDYTVANPEVTVLTSGTLKSAPPAFDGIRFHYIHEGAVDAQPA